MQIMLIHTNCVQTKTVKADSKTVLISKTNEWRPLSRAHIHNINDRTEIDNT